MIPPFCTEPGEVEGFAAETARGCAVETPVAPEPGGPETLPPPDGLRTDTLGASVAVLLVLTIVQRLVGFLRSVLFCRWLDAEQLGQWDMAFGFLMLAAPLVVFGLPGSLGRYVEHYRHRGLLRPFLARTAAATFLLAALGVTAVLLSRAWFSELVFGSRRHDDLMLVVAVGLGVIVAFNYAMSLFTALRQVRAISLAQFGNSLLFAGLGVGLLWWWRRDTTSVVVAFVAACLATLAASAAWFACLWSQLPAPAGRLPARPLWAKLLPFAFWLWTANGLSNLFGIADRFLIVHFSGLGAVDALDMVGQYHTARIFPVLFVGVAEMFAAIVTPHLSADWEAGRHERVAARLRLILKATGLALAAASAVVMIGSPLLFNVVWQHRYFDGWTVMPWTLASSIWISLAAVSFNYLWCAERSRWVCVALATGLAVNVALNLALLPVLGLLGAALAMAVSSVAHLAILWWVARRLGMEIDRGLRLVALLPLLMPLGPWWVLAAVVLTACGAVPGATCFNAEERRRLGEVVAEHWQRVRRFGT